MIEASFPLLSCIILWPLLGALVVGLLPDSGLAKKTGLAFAGFELLLTVVLCLAFNPDNGGFQWVERHAWIPSLHIDYLIGIDGISVLFLPMSALLTLMALGASWNMVRHLGRFHLALLLVLESVTMGIFCALDLMLFFLFWELTLPVIFFLIGLWGIGAERRLAAVKYTVFMLFGGAALLAAIIIVALNATGQLQDGIAHGLVFSLPELLKSPLPEHLQTVVFVLLVFGFTVKAPLPPFHSWLPTVAMEAAPHTTALLVGLKLGVYGLLRFALPLAPTAAVEYSWALGIVGGVALIYAGLIALQQNNLRRLLAYASISHVGLVVVGIAALNMQGLQGAIFQMFNFTLVASSLMLIAGFIQQRVGSTEALHLSGLAKVMPKLTCGYFLFMLASIGLPGTSGFPAELLLLVGALTSHASLAFIAVAGAVLGAAYMLSFTRRVFWGAVGKGVGQISDIRPRELLVLAVPALLVVIIGFYPQGIVNISHTAAEAWLSCILDQQGLKSGRVAGGDVNPSRQ
jgi:NADH-quinone oxidoreductase subunit M